ncbi:MAG TPA: PKD domain-containing protein [Mucilaginibacter sp.]|nr:PKD domain-containing protein [Mucilaginibacter sp.]
MNIKFIILYFLCVLFIAQSFAQGVNVNPSTGSASTVIPIYSIASGQVSMPVSLVYSGSGVKVKDVEGNAGMNWQLVTGGQVSRQVRGLPDDVSKDTVGNARLGWMNASNTAVAAINSFTIANNGGLTCANETTDISYINSHFPTNYDTEPDIFYVNAPGLSCQLVYDPGTSKFHSVNQQDLVITYTTYSSPGRYLGTITSFTIKNDKGITYTFSTPEYMVEGTNGGSANFLATKYNQYLNGIYFADSWYLTTISDQSGNAIQLNYTTALPRYSIDPVMLYVGGSTSASLQYYVKKTLYAKILSNITATNANSTAQHISVSFAWTSINYQNLGGTGQTVISSITAPGRNISFVYSPVSASTGYVRYFLRNVSDAGCSSPINYIFKYVGETQGPLGVLATYTTILPDSASTKVDYWGYYAGTAGASNLEPSVYVNPFNFSYQRYLIKVSASPGAIYAYTLSYNNRGADPTTVATGALNKIIYPQGGSTNIVYESNDYYDTPSLSVVQGGGIRVKQTIDSVGNGSTSRIVKNYSYLNSSGVSSGKPISLPSFSFTIPYSGSNTGSALWASATALSAYDLSSEEHTIMYQYAKASQTGAGSTAYQFTVPATYWDTGSAPSCSGCSSNEWYPTSNLVARSNCALPAYGPVTNYIYSYPFIPNPNYDFERGLPVKVINYNDSGTEVSETNYTYQRSFTPSTITAFKYDDNINGSLSVRSYDKYTIYYNTSELNATIISKVYDSKNLTTAQSDTTTYSYGSSNHKLLTQVQKTNSDRSIGTTIITYTKDFPNAAAGSNSYVNALYYLQQQNINTPVETYQQITRGATTLTTSASLTLFDDFTTGGTTSYLPVQQLQQVLPDGGSFTPYSIVGTVPQSSTYDSKYYPIANYTYDNTGYPSTTDDGNKNKSTTVTDHYTNQPAAIFKNVASGEFAFKDYDSYPAPSIIGFTTSGSGSYTPVGSHAGNAAGIASTQTVTSGTITKNTIAKNYIFSIWINAVTPGTMTVAVSGITSRTISYSGGWKYYELTLPAASILSSITVGIATDHNISIDDILFYPDIADVGTVTYDPTTHFKIASTDVNGVSAYYSYDQWGRLLYQFDQDKNIVQKNTYITAANVQDFVKPVLNHSPGNNSVTNITPVTLSTSSYSDPCTMAGFTYTWNFGDGTGDVVTTSAVAPAHTYATPATYVGTLTVGSPYFGSKTADTVHIIVKQSMASLSYHDYAVSGGISSVVFSNVSNTFTYNTAQLNGGQVLPGTYTVTINPVGGAYNPGTGKGYTNMVFSDGMNGQCFGYTGSPFVFTWTVIGGHTLDFSVYNDNTCPFN